MIQYIHTHRSDGSVGRGMSEQYVGTKYFLKCLCHRNVYSLNGNKIKNFNLTYFTDFELDNEHS